MPSPTSKALIRNRVRRSVLLLDRDRPGWYKKINLGKLDMSDCNVCVLGQLLGARRKRLLWEDLLALANLTELGACQRGFNIGDELTATLDVDYTDLEQAWLSQIEKRRAADR